MVGWLVALGMKQFYISVLFFQVGMSGSLTKGELSCPKDSFNICLLAAGYVEGGLLLTKSEASALVLRGALYRSQQG